MESVLSSVISIVSCVCAITAAAVAVFKAKQAKKKMIAEEICQNRMKWLEDVRQNMYAFLMAYINENKDEKIAYKVKTELYFRAGNENYEKVIDTMNKCINEKYSEDTYQELIIHCQNVLSDVWIRVKRETGVTKEMDDSINKELYEEKKKLR